MIDSIWEAEFSAASGVEWRALYRGAKAYFRTGDFATSAIDPELPIDAEGNVVDIETWEGRD